MHKRLKQLCATLLCLCGCVPVHKTTPAAPMQWVAYYNTDLPAETFRHYDLVIFDGRHYPDFTVLKGTKTTVLAYITLGEIYGDVPEQAILQEEKAILYKNPNWDSYAIDLRSRVWRRMVLGAVDKAVSHGFDGVMLDTVDSPLEWARLEGSETHEAMQDAAVDLIKAIHKKYPKIKIMLNRGFIIAPRVAFSIDYLLAESVLTYKDENTGQYRLVPPKAYNDAVAQLHSLVARTEHLRIMTLDYWDLDDVDGMGIIYKKQRSAGFFPYVTSPDLRQFTPEK